ncbi:MAG: rhamnulokinase [Actinomycetota bacterium]|nr:rhamnulokinase [Actinomycetota bacterium]
MVSKNYLIFDFGASNGRAIIAGYDGKRFELEVVHRFENRPVFAAGTLYWDVLRLFSELKEGIAIAQKKYKNIESLGVDTWGVDFALFDKNKKMLSNPQHYRDDARIEAAKAMEKAGYTRKKLFMLTGGLILDIMGIYHFYDLKLSNSPVLNNADKFLMMPDIFNYFLTGNMFNEFTEATTSIVYDLKNNTWSREILEFLGIGNDLFPEIVQPGTKIGNIQKSIADELDIKPISVIAPASHDTASAVTGIPVIDKNKTWCFVSMGTWLVQGMEIDKPIVNEDIYASGFANEGGSEGKNILPKNINGLWVIQQCMEKWRRDAGRNIAWAEIDKLFPKAKAFASFIDVDDSVFLPPSPDMPKVIAEYCKKKGQDMPSDIGSVARCFYESIVLKIRFNVSKLENLTGKKIELMQLVGGGTNNRLLCQWIADALGVHVAAGPTETTAVGNLIMQMKGSGEIKNVEEGRQLCIRSTDVKRYEPFSSEKIKWDTAYEKYLMIL